MKVTIEFDFWPPHCYPVKASREIDGCEVINISSFQEVLLPLIEEVFYKAHDEQRVVAKAIELASGGKR